MFKRILNKIGFGNKAAKLDDKFISIYEKNLFKGNESISGPGSDLTQTEVVRKALPELLKKLEIKTMLDAPCGDFYWMKLVDTGEIIYTGIDIVPEIIQKNKEAYSNAKHVFLCRDIVNDMLPSADIILCRDCLVHLNYDQAKRAIMNFKRSGIRYLLSTTFPGRINYDLGNIIWRPLDLAKTPFNLSEPLLLINEHCTEDNNAYQDKSLGLWDLSKIEME